MKFGPRLMANLAHSAAPCVEKVLDGETTTGLKLLVRDAVTNLLCYAEEAKRREDRHLITLFDERLEEAAVAIVLVLDGQCNGKPQERVRVPLEQLLKNIEAWHGQAPQYYQDKAETYVSSRGR